MAKPAGTGGALSVKPRRCHRRPLAFFSLVFILSIPFWIIGQASPAELLPALPVGALMLLTPVIAASILVYRRKEPLACGPCCSEPSTLYGSHRCGTSLSSS